MEKIFTHKQAAIYVGISSALFFIMLSLLGFNSLFLTAASIPVLVLAYHGHLQQVILSLAITSFLLLMISPDSSLFYILAISGPVILIAAHITRNHSNIAIISELTLYAMVCVAAIEISLFEAGGISAWLTERMNPEAFETMNPKLVEQMLWLMKDGAFLLVSMMACWGVIFYLFHLWLVQKILKHKSKVTIQNFGQFLPSWLLWSLITAIFAGFLAPEPLKFIGISSFVIILLPYVFYGAIHTPLRNALKRSLGWALVVCITMLILAWPALLLAAFGVVKHTRQLAK